MFETALSLCCLASLNTPTNVDSKVREVTIYPGSALVTRIAELPSKNGSFVLGGLPWSLDPNNLRIRAHGADVVGMEMRERHTAAATNERIEELRAKTKALERELASLQDDRATLDQIAKHLDRLLALDENDHNAQVKSGQSSPEAWAANLAFLAKEVAETRAKSRENQWKTEDLNTRLEDARRELGSCTGAGGVDSRELVLDLIGSGDGQANVEFDYVVGNAGWQPVYDLRAARDAKSVELDYRAHVWQASGEDWNDVELSLSTAQPNRGAQGPEPTPLWLRLLDPRVSAREQKDALKSLGYLAADSAMPASKRAEMARDDNAPRPFAQVESQGLSARFHLARRESIQSRPQPTTVLIGQKQLESTPEYFCTPSLDTSVWLCGRTKNSSEWMLLPGDASVYFGSDFVGHASVAAVQPGEEFTLHLGADSALTCERVQKQDLHEQGGLFSSKAAHTQSWLVRLKNNGAAAASVDGSAMVFVREAIPRSTDERLKIELASTKPEPMKSERWKKDFDENGIATWAMRVPKSSEAILEYTLEIKFPEHMQISG